MGSDHHDHAGIITIERHIPEEQRSHPEATGALTSLLYDLALAGKVIASRTTRGELLDFIAQQAGWYASDGYRSILDVQPKALHQRVPLFIGNHSLVETAEAFSREFDGEGDAHG